MSGNASIGGDFSTILKNEGALSNIADLEEKIKKLEAAIRARDEIINKTKNSSTEAKKEAA